MELFWLGGLALLAGFIDAVSGGGGLIQVPALLVLKLPYQTTLGTNKLASIAGTLMATGNYLRRIKVRWLLLIPAIACAFLGSSLGAHSTSLINPAVARWLMLVLLVLVALYTYLRPDLGRLGRPVPAGWRAPVAMSLIGLGGGFYDGFFGPGTGSLLAFLLVGVMGFDFLEATASSKIINATTNLAALTVFFPEHVLLPLGLVMAACNLTGGLIGSLLALRHGAGFVRWVFLVVMVLLIGRYAYDIIQAL